MNTYQRPILQIICLRVISSQQYLIVCSPWGKISPNFDRNNTDMPSLLGFNLPMMHPKRRHSMSGKLLSFLTAITDVYEYSQERMTAAMIATSLYGFQVRSLSTMLALGIIVSS